MPITSSGQIALIADIEAEFDQTGTEDISLFQARDDAGLDAGQVAMSQFYSLSDVVCTTNDLSNYNSLTSSSIVLNGQVTNSGGGTVTNKGFYVGTSSTPTNNTKYSYGSGGASSWSQTITGLSASTTYYIQSFTISEAGECAGTRVVSFTTPAPSLQSTVGFSGSGSWYWDPCSNNGSVYIDGPNMSMNNTTGGNITAYTYATSSGSITYFSISYQTGSTIQSGSLAGTHYWGTGSKSWRYRGITMSFSNAPCGGYKALAYVQFSRSGYSSFTILMGGARNSY